MTHKHQMCIKFKRHCVFCVLFNNLIVFAGVIESKDDFIFHIVFAHFVLLLETV